MPRRTFLLVAIAALVVALTVACLAGCTPTGGRMSPGARATEPATAGDESPGAGDDDSGGETVQALMLGRSVMAGWFDHWGYDGTNPVLRNGYRLEYREVESPPGIAVSAARAIGEAPPGSIVFFKLCFVDFESGHPAYVDRARLLEYHDWIEQVVSAARDRGVTLVLGNALPRVQSETNAGLTGVHEAYNRDLEDIAAANDGVYVFDLYSRLSRNGALRDDYAASPGDSHLNDAAYSMLDEALFAELDRIAGR